MGKSRHWRSFFRVCVDRGAAYTLAVALAGLSLPVQAEHKDREYKISPEAKAKLGQLLARPDARERALEAVKQTIFRCRDCHGEDGNSVKREVPSLAGQNPYYLMEQFESFLSGRRHLIKMKDKVQRLSPDQRIAMAVWYSKQTPKPVGGDPQLAEQGKPLYLDRCAKCHGTDGRLDKGYAYLAGQPPVYTAAALRRFRDEPAFRDDPDMADVTLGLTEDDVDAIAHYLAGLP